MTGRARGRGVGADQGEPGHAVIKGGAIPALGGMATGAVAHSERRAGAGMHGIIRFLLGRKVAPGIAAVCRRNL